MDRAGDICLKCVLGTCTGLQGACSPRHLEEGDL